MKKLLTPRGRSGASIKIDASEITHSGYLHKEGGNNKEFRRRWFVLAGKRAWYYKDESDAAKGTGSAKGDLTITGMGHVHATSKAAQALEPSTTPLCFYLDAEGGRRFILFAETFADKLTWLKAIAGVLGKTIGVPRPRLEEQFAKQLDPATASPAWAKIAEGIKQGKAGETARAQVAFDEARALAASEGGASTCQSFAQFELGRLLLAKGNVAEATSHLERANADAATAEWQSLKLQLGWCYGLSGRRDDAEALYSAVLDDDLLCCNALLDRGKMHIRSYEWVRAGPPPASVFFFLEPDLSFSLCRPRFSGS